MKNKDIVLYDSCNLREEALKILKSSGLNQQEIYNRGGPSPITQTMWKYGATRNPHLKSILRAFKACGYNLIIR